MARHPEIALSHVPTPVPKHAPFLSIYRENFEVVQERRGRVTLYPHTEQLPLLLRALNYEFYGALPDRIARVDRRADGFHKTVLRNCAMIFCGTVNRKRTDQLRLFDLPDPDLVFKVAIVQQITETGGRGCSHRFRFYAGADFFPEIRLSGRRLVFADHVIQRFCSRVPNHIGEDLSLFLDLFYGHAIISVPCGQGRAFVFAYNDSVLAFPYRENTPGEYFIATCLTALEINSLQLELPPCVHNFHYGGDYTSPTRRHWRPILHIRDIYEKWQQKKPPKPGRDDRDKYQWNRKMGYLLRDVTVKQGYGPGSGIYFMDHIRGPHIAQTQPGQPESSYDELEEAGKLGIEGDWSAAFARRDAILRGPHQAAAPVPPPTPAPTPAATTKP